MSNKIKSQYIKTQNQKFLEFELCHLDLIWTLIFDIWHCDCGQPFSI